MDTCFYAAIRYGTNQQEQRSHPLVIAATVLLHRETPLSRDPGRGHRKGYAWHRPSRLGNICLVNVMRSTSRTVGLLKGWKARRRSSGFVHFNGCIISWAK